MLPFPRCHRLRDVFGPCGALKLACVVFCLAVAGCENPVVRPGPVAGLTLSGDPAADYEKLRALQFSTPPPQLKSGSDEFFAWVQERSRILHERGLEYLARYPSEPRRWDVLLMLEYTGTLQVRVQADGFRRLSQDEAERLEWETRYHMMLESLLTVRDASKESRDEALRQLISYGSLRVLQGEAADTMVAKVLEWTATYERVNPKPAALKNIYYNVATMLNAVSPERCVAFLKEQRSRHTSDKSPDSGLKAQIHGLLRLVAAQSQPAAAMWQQFQSFDPTLTDLTPYRGKVVLVAYLPVDWSTYTIELEKAYRQHHAAGFEIVQVAYYNSNPTAPLEQRDFATMRRFVVTKQWPWRVVWDAKQNPEQSFWAYWGQNALPAFMFIGRDGCLVREQVGKQSLEARVSRALAAKGHEGETKG